MNFEQELRLVLMCARTYIDVATAADIDRLLATNMDWERLWTLANQHGVVPLLYQNLQTAAAGRLSSDIQLRLQNQTRQIAARNLSLTHELLEILGQFQRQQILAVPLKGPVLSQIAYGNLSTRTFGDLDIIVHRHEVPRALNLLTDLGYTRQAYSAQHHFRLRHPMRNVVLELHWEFTQHHWSKLYFGDMARRLETIDLFGSSVPTLARTDLLLYLCLHGSKHFWRRLRWVCDVAAMVRGFSADDWNSVIAEAKQQRAQRVLFLGLSMAHDLLGLALPDTIHRMIDATPVVGAQAARMQQELFTDQPVKVMFDRLAPVQYQLTDAREDRLRILWLVLLRHLSPTSSDRALVQLPTVLAPLYYPLRALRLLQAYRLTWWKRWLTVPDKPPVQKSDKSE